VPKYRILNEKPSVKYVLGGNCHLVGFSDLLSQHSVGGTAETTKPKIANVLARI
jgi:hypothetical protein